MKRQRKKKKSSNIFHKKESFIQPKLSVGKAGDKYEVEADKMADKVVNKTQGDSAVQKMGGEEELQQKPLAESVTSIQREAMPQEEEKPVQKMGEKEEEQPVQKQEMQEEEEAVQTKGKEEEEAVQTKGEEEEEAVQTKGEEEEEAVQTKGEEEEEAVQTKAEEEEQPVQKMEEEEKPVQTKQNNTQKKKGGQKNVESRLRESKGAGNVMDTGTLHEMETGFGVDLSDVNIHTDSKAEQMSQDLGAQAFTHGKDIYFNKNKYDPNSKDGKHLLAHELTHTIQQNKDTVQKKGNSCDPAAISAARQQAFFRVQNVKHSLSGLHPTYGHRLQQDMMRLARKLVSPRIRSVRAVQQLMDNMLTALSSDNRIVCGPEIDNCSVWNAYVENNTGPIHLCDSFFDLSPEGQIRTLIHEAAHAAGIGSPEQEQYIPVFDCETGADDYTSADAWAHFVHCASNQTPDQPDQP